MSTEDARRLRRPDPAWELAEQALVELVVGDVVEVGYVLGERLIRAAKVAVFTPEG